MLGCLKFLSFSAFFRFGPRLEEKSEALPYLDLHFWTVIKDLFRWLAYITSNSAQRPSGTVAAMANTYHEIVSRLITELFAYQQTRLVTAIANKLFKINSRLMIQLILYKKFYFPNQRRAH